MLATAHLRRRRTQNALTVAGIAVGVAVLISALSLTNGFTGMLINATLQASPHLSFTPYTPSGRDLALEAEFSSNEKISAWAPFVVDKALLTRPGDETRDAGTDFSTIFGLPPEGSGVLGFAPEQRDKLMKLQPDELMLGSALARNIGAAVGDTINVLNSSQNRQEMRLGGTFHTGNYLIDSGYAFAPIGTVQSMRGIGDNVSGYQLRLHNPEDARPIALEVQNRHSYAAMPWQDLYGSLLEQLALQKKVIAFVVFLIVVVAAFGIANVMTLAVFEKSQEIAILRAIGATERLIGQVFLLEGLVLGLLGLLLGNLLGLGVAAYFTVRPFQIPGDLYFINTLPVEVRISDLLWVNAVGLFTTLLAAWLPAKRAASMEPAQIIR